jgi:uncharacterized protein (TIGR00730 family)
MSFSVGLFCGSRAGASAAFAEAATAFGAGVGERGWRLVYGGGDVGLMGLAARAAMAAGGEVEGIIPRRLLDREVGKRDITRLVVTETMAERKERIIQGSDAFVILPGGLGTLDELLEVLTLRQLGYIDKPILLVDIEGYWLPLEALVKRVVDCGFAKPSAAALMTTVPDVPTLFATLQEAVPAGT